MQFDLCWFVEPCKLILYRDSNFGRLLCLIADYFTFQVSNDAEVAEVGGECERTEPEGRLRSK